MLTLPSTNTTLLLVCTFLHAINLFTTIQFVLPLLSAIDSIDKHVFSDE